MKSLQQRIWLVANLFLIALISGPASATLIDFESLAGGTVITNQFAGVTFSSNAGFQNIVTTQPGIGFGANFICTAAVGSGVNCTQQTILTFATGVSGLSFWQVGDNQTVNGTTVALVDVFVGGAFAATVNILGDTNFNNPNLVDLTAFSNVTSIRMHDITDGGGLGWDNFSFTTTAVPEPETYALMLAGLGLLGFAARRRKQKAA